MADYQKGQRKVKTLITKAAKERDTKGYRENLGFDQHNNLTDYLNGLNLTYSEKATLIQEFYRACEKI